MIRFRLLLPLLALVSLELGAQDVRWSVGVDPGLWASGWRNVQLGAQLHPELSLAMGAGTVRNGQGVFPMFFRPRPVGFERGWMTNVGLRFLPVSEDGRRVQAMVGIDYQKERYHMRFRSTLPLDENQNTALQQFERTDLKMLVGGRCALGQHMSFAAHVGLGYNLRSADDWIGSGQVSQVPGMPRMIGMELMYRL